MKAISLWQPWASLMAYEFKTIETRSWETKHRGPLLIHAAKRPMDIIHQAAIDDFESKGIDWMDLPYGCIVAKVCLLSCQPAESMIHIGISEFSHGDYSRGRKAWITDFIKRYDVPMPFRGRQTIFNVPDDLLNSDEDGGELGMMQAKQYQTCGGCRASGRKQRFPAWGSWTFTCEWGHSVGWAGNPYGPCFKATTWKEYEEVKRHMSEGENLA